MNTEFPEVQAKWHTGDSSTRFGTWIVTCPFCFEEHVHGSGEFGNAAGHRLSHCVPRKGNSGYTVLAPPIEIVDLAGSDEPCRGCGTDGDCDCSE